MVQSLHVDMAKEQSRRQKGRYINAMTAGVSLRKVTHTLQYALSERRHEAVLSRVKQEGGEREASPWSSFCFHGCARPVLPTA